MMIARSLTAAGLLLLAALPATAQTPDSQEACFALIDQVATEAEEKTLDAKATKDIGALLRRLEANCGGNKLSEAGNTVRQLRAIIARMPN
jgi:hypothetical protein